MAKETKVRMVHLTKSLDKKSLDKTDEAVAEKLADIMLRDKKLKEKLEKCPRPVNCDKIILPKVNN